MMRLSFAARVIAMYMVMRIVAALKDANMKIGNRATGAWERVIPLTNKIRGFVLAMTVVVTLLHSTHSLSQSLSMSVAKERMSGSAQSAIDGALDEPQNQPSQDPNSAACTGYGCNIPNAPMPKPMTHSFFDSQTFLTLSSSAASLIGDVNMSCTQPGSQCKQIAAGAAGFFAAEVAAEGVAHLTGHHTIERWIGPSAIVFHVARMVWISTHRP